MESSGSQDSVPSPSTRGGSEVGPGLRKIRSKAASRQFETADLELSKPRKTFQKPIAVSIPAGYSATDFEIPHNFGAIPSDVMFGLKNANTTIWRGTRDWTRKAIYLRAGAAVTVVLYLVP